ncbi:unnamed protein product [Hymenolepis diminuta]|uniref:Uncharacterized protein n=1 Tax=Hymenolepis diminuta TaxID=6216 RepID=A0A564Z2G3_HYMDI|nr:unnamed protein product [Hymenolepis diminuta]
MWIFPYPNLLKLNEFHSDREGGQTVANWFDKYKDVFRNDLADIQEGSFQMPTDFYGSSRALSNGCLCRIFRMIEGDDDIKLEGLANECGKLDVKCGRGMNPQKSGGHHHANRISSEAVSWSVSSLRKPITEC